MKTYLGKQELLVGENYNDKNILLFYVCKKKNDDLCNRQGLEMFLLWVLSR